MMSSSVSEKGTFATKFLSGIIGLSIVLLISSSFSLLEYHRRFSVPKSVIQLVVVRNSSISPTLHAKSEITSATICPSSEKQRTSSRKRLCGAKEPHVRVFMYDLPPKFHFGMLGWEGNGNEIWPDLSGENRIPSYPGGLNLQHSAEYWLTLDLLSSTTGNISRPCSAIRVENSTEADIIFVPFFSSLSYNRHSKVPGKRKASTDWVLQEELLDFLQQREEWKRHGGKDHLVVAHHPNSMLNARIRLSSCMFILADFGRYPFEIANIEKDIIAPYKHMVKSIAAADSPSFHQRPTLAYFQGAIHRKDGGAIRQDLYYLLKNERDVHFSFGRARTNGIRDAGKGMASSKFCLIIAGDTPSSNRLFDAISTHCIPVIISDDIELPFEDVLDYSEFSIFIMAADAVKRGYIVNLLRSIRRDKWSEMWERLRKISPYFEYQFPSQVNDVVDMIWQAVYRKKTATLLYVHRKNRYKNSL